MHDLKRTLERAKTAAFFDEVQRKIATSEEEVLEAAKQLSVDKRTRLRRYGEGAAVGAAAFPVMSLAGNLAGAAAGPRGQRAEMARQALRKAVSRPELASNVTRGVLGGGGVQAARDGLELGRAKKTVQGFLSSHGVGDDQ
jgi:hypothetical protein